MKLPPSILAVVALSTTARSAVISSGMLDVPIPFTLVGVSINVDAGTVAAEQGAGWHINPFFGGGSLA
ncbi:MAG: hypothetical protein WCJ66_17895 [Verrucomicrobiota bacterium]